MYRQFFTLFLFGSLFFLYDDGSRVVPGVSIFAVVDDVTLITGFLITAVVITVLCFVLDRDAFLVFVATPPDTSTAGTTI